MGDDFWAPGFGALRRVSRQVGWPLPWPDPAMLPGYLDTDTRYVDTPIRHFSKNTDTEIRKYI